VALGGHDVPADVVRRRFGRSLSNFFALYMPLADEWTLFDNSTPPLARSVAARVAGQLTVTEPTTWRKLQKISSQPTA
jgi:predicted ABC-type ATPase